MLDSVVWRPVGKSGAVGLNMSLVKLQPERVFHVIRERNE
jgi:hypothetical protein